MRQLKSGNFNVKDSCALVDHKKCEDKELPGKLVNAQCYHWQMINLNHALIEKQLEWAIRHSKVILLHDNAPVSHIKTGEKNLEIA